MSLNKTTIDWPELNYTWNPIVGCKNRCSYCYAKKLHDKRHKAYCEGKKLPIQYKKPFTDIQYFPERINEPLLLKKPSVIFLGSMSDIFAPWMLSAQIIIDIIATARQHTFMLLTKFPENYTYYTFPDNCFLGATIILQNKQQSKIQLEKLKEYTRKNRTFISLEPILGPTTILNQIVVSEWMDLIIVGSMTGNEGFLGKIPDRTWLNFEGKNIYFKKSIRKLYPDLPQWRNKDENFKIKQNNDSKRRI